MACFSRCRAALQIDLYNRENSAYSLKFSNRLRRNDEKGNERRRDGLTIEENGNRTKA
jgi:hypothetical protein